LHAQTLYRLAHILGDGLNDEKVGVPVVFSQVVFGLLEIEAVPLVAVHEYGEGGLPAPRYSVVIDVVLNVKIRSAPDFGVPNMTFPGEAGDGVASGFALRSLLQRH
jgi:hypothetical protein